MIIIGTSKKRTILKVRVRICLQRKAASILTPMWEDVRRINSSEQEILNAKLDLQKAAILLGENYFLYKNLRARALFLSSLIFKQKGYESCKLPLFSDHSRLEF